MTVIHQCHLTAEASEQIRERGADLRRRLIVLRSQRRAQQPSPSRRERIQRELEAHGFDPLVAHEIAVLQLQLERAGRGQHEDEEGSAC